MIEVFGIHTDKERYAKAEVVKDNCDELKIPIPAEINEILSCNEREKIPFMPAGTNLSHIAVGDIPPRTGVIEIREI